MRKLLFFSGLLMAAVLMPSAVAAETIPLEQAASLFGTRPYVEHISLSPDGTQVAFISPTAEGGALIYVASVVGAEETPRAIFRSGGDPEQLERCNWVSNSRLLCRAYAAMLIGSNEYTNVTRYFALNADGSDFKVLKSSRGSGTRLGNDIDGGKVIDWLPGQDNSVLMLRQYIPESSVGTLLAQHKQGFGVDMVDTLDFKSRIVESPQPLAREFYTDGKGQVRIMGAIDETDSGYETRRMRYYYRRQGSRNWELLSEIGTGENEFDPWGVDPDLDVAYGLKKLNGRFAAYSKALDGSGTEKLLFAHPEVDVSGFLQIGRNRRIVGASFVTDVEQTAFFDPSLEKLATSLGKALPNLPQVQVVDSSLDGNRLLIWAGSDRDAGRYYMYDKGTRQLKELLMSRPWLKDTVLAGMKHISFPARDGTPVPGYLSLPVGVEAKNLPAIVMPHGGPGSRDEWGFDWLVQFFVSQGYAVIQPNFRGSTGYGDAWFKHNGFQSWQAAVSDVNDAGRWLVSQGIADPSRLAIVGWSYGGYAALQSTVVDPGLFKSVVAIAPVSDFGMLKEDSRIFGDFLLVQAVVGSGPHVEDGSPARRAQEITAPVLLFHGGRDVNTSIRQSRLMEDRLKAAGKPVELVVFDKLDHYLDDGKARAAMLSKIGQFLKK